jgi:hypothetical protein
MALTYTWKVTGLKKRDQVNAEGATLIGAVVQTYWECKGVDENGKEGSFSGATPFTAENVPAGSFAAFETLTEETVLGWIKSVVANDPSYKAHIDGRIIDQIDAANVTDATPPWQTEEVTPVPPQVIESAPETDPVE